MSQIDLNEFINVPEYEGLYAINKDGQLYSYRQKRILKANLQKGKYCGYYRVNLFKDNKYTTKRIHQLLALVYIPNPLNLPEINHINGIKTDNRIENLEWVTHLRNMRHANETGLFNKELQKKHAKIMGLNNRKISYDQAQKIRRLHECKMYNQRQLAKIYGTCFQNINLIVNYKTQLLEDCI